MLVISRAYQPGPCLELHEPQSKREPAAQNSESLRLVCPPLRTRSSLITGTPNLSVCPLARAGPDAFAFVPFLDLANHADAPQAVPPGPSGASGGAATPAPPSNQVANADFRASPAGAGSGEVSRART